ncbi:MAG TPA: hypothetical protein VFN74_08350 [Chloroflexota bacterium]|nr:hypothetical protein [Chloroflexota bacterium]
MADRFLTRGFVHLSLGVGLLGGFGLGGASFAASALGLPTGAYWPALAQSHGHAQLFGFAGLMVLGVALVFLPRLRGAPLRGAEWVPLVLVLYGGGVIVRVVIQSGAPFLGPLGLGRFGFAAGGVIALSALLELAGALIGTGLLATTGVSGPPLAQRPGLRQVLPLLVAAWLGFLAALALNTLAAFDALWRSLLGDGIPLVGQAPWLLDPALDALLVRIAFLGWLVPMSVAFAARNFPLFLWTKPAPGRWLTWGLVVLMAGLTLDVAASLFGLFAEIGTALEGIALLWLTAVVGALGAKKPPPGRPRDPTEAQLAGLTRLPLTEAFVWLAVAGALLLLRAALPFLGLPPPPEDVLRHTLGAGFVMLLIVGMSLRLIPGFAGGVHLDRLRAAGAAIWSAQVAALLRVAPPLALWLTTTAGLDPAPPRLVSVLLSFSGLAGAISLAALWLTLSPALAARSDPYDSPQ